MSQKQSIASRPVKKLPLAYATVTDKTLDFSTFSPACAPGMFLALCHIKAHHQRRPASGRIHFHNELKFRHLFPKSVKEKKDKGGNQWTSRRKAREQQQVWFSRHFTHQRLSRANHLKGWDAKLLAYVPHARNRVAEPPGGTRRLLWPVCRTWPNQPSEVLLCRSLKVPSLDLCLGPLQWLGQYGRNDYTY